MGYVKARMLKLTVTFDVLYVISMHFPSLMLVLPASMMLQ